MAGSKMRQVSDTLQLFLRALPSDCRFNIVGFGSTHETLFASEPSVPYNESTLATATEHAARLNANLGGTEIFRPLDEVLSQRATQGFAKQVFVSSFPV